MANNRLYLCSVDSDGNIRDRVCIAKHTSGAWHAINNIDHLDNMFEDAFINAWGITLCDQFMITPLPELYSYNDQIENVKWICTPNTKFNCQ